MAAKQIWLIYYRAVMSENSSMNEDGSDMTYGISAIPEADLIVALKRLKSELSSDHMALLEIYKCLRSDAIQMPGESDLSEAIDYIVRSAESRGLISTTSIGNESLDEDE